MAQLVEHHLAKVRVAGSNPVVRSEVPEAVSRADGPLGSSVPARLPGGSACGGMAEWFRQGPAKPCTRVRFPLPPRGRLAQRESASLTRKRSLVQSQYRPRIYQAERQTADLLATTAGGLLVAALAPTEVLDLAARPGAPGPNCCIQRDQNRQQARTPGSAESTATSLPYSPGRGLPRH